LAFDGMTMTTKGINLQTKVQAGATLNFTKIKVGDGVLSSGTTLASLTDLVESKLTVEIESVTSLGDGTYRVRGTLTNASVTTGFFLREVGVFATDPDDGEILYSVANAGDECDYLPAGGGSVVVEQVVDIITAVGSASSVTATIDEDSVLLSKATFTEHQEASPIDHPDSSVTDAKIGTRTMDDTVAAASGAGVLTNLLSKIGYMIKSITGKSSWYTAPDTTLAKAASHITATSAAHAASAISNTANGTISSTTVQAALNELDTEKAALAGATFTGAIIEAVSSSIASAATVNLTAVTGNSAHITGTTAITAVTMTKGQRITLIFDGSLTLTHNSTKNNLPGGVNITTQAGDRAIYFYDGTTVYCVAYIPYAGYPRKNYNDFRNVVSTVTGNTAATISGDYCPFTGASFSSAIDFTTTGAGALDTGSIAASSFYFGYRIFNPSTGAAACIASLSSTASGVTLPSGYTECVRLSSNFLTNSSSKLYYTIQRGREVQYIVDGTNLTGLRQMASGTAGSISTPTWVAVSVSSFVPTTASAIKVLGATGESGASIWIAPNSNYGTLGNTSNPPPYGVDSCTGATTTCIIELVLESTNIYWASDGSSHTLCCFGYKDNL